LWQEMRDALGTNGTAQKKKRQQGLLAFLN
jgi:hypothetical protein